MKKLLLLIAFAIVLVACGDSDSGDSEGFTPKATTGTSTAATTPVEANPKGIGEIKHVTLNDPLDQDMVKKGKAIYEMKCAACHKLSGQRVVGPSWAGITDRREPEWIMNMITNVEVMLDKDPVAQKMLEECLTRMPNQNVSVGDARYILEFMYQNDIDQGS